MTTATTGTGTLTLGSAVSGFLSFSGAGISDAETVTYAIKDGANSEIGRGVYTASGTTLTRAAVLKSTNSNNAISLSGSAEVFISPSAEDFLGLNNLSVSVGADRLTGWSHSAQALAHVTPGTGLSLAGNSLDLVGGYVLLSSATASASATIDFTGLSSTYDLYAIVISDATCATDAVHLWSRFGTGGGPTYQTTNYAWTVPLFGYTANANYSSNSGSATGVSTTDRNVLTTWGPSTNGLGNAAGESMSGVYYIAGAAGSNYKRIWGGYILSRSSDSLQQNGSGGGQWLSTTAITAVRFGFSDNSADRNIATGTFALYGMKKS